MPTSSPSALPGHTSRSANCRTIPKRRCSRFLLTLASSTYRSWRSCWTRTNRQSSGRSQTTISSSEIQSPGNTRPQTHTSRVMFARNLPKPRMRQLSSPIFSATSKPWPAFSRNACLLLTLNSVSARHGYQRPTMPALFTLTLQVESTATTLS